jgi:osmotically-inducible protein OsmY
LEILEDITDQLTWSPFVSENDITVTVDNGIVTLSGTIPSWSELTDAEKNAYQGSAKDVQNNLVVDNRYYGPYGPGYYAYPYYSYGRYF